MSNASASSSLKTSSCRLRASPGTVKSSSTTSLSRVPSRISLCTTSTSASSATLLVNAAGFFIPKPFLEYDQQFYDSYMDLNYALFFLTQTVVEGMIARGDGGSIVNLGSMWTHQAIGLTPSSGHSMQKAGLHALTHNLAIELAGHQIRVNAVAPAPVD